LRTSDQIEKGFVRSEAKVTTGDKCSLFQLLVRTIESGQLKTNHAAAPNGPRKRQGGINLSRLAPPRGRRSARILDGVLDSTPVGRPLPTQNDRPVWPRSHLTRAYLSTVLEPRAIALPDHWRLKRLQCQHQQSTAPHPRVLLREPLVCSRIGARRSRDGQRLGPKSFPCHFACNSRETRCPPGSTPVLDERLDVCDSVNNSVSHAQPPSSPASTGSGHRIDLRRSDLA
jgi:hypothetical protein